jgi:hypothetical protein
MAAMDMGMATWVVAVAVITTVGAEAAIAVAMIDRPDHCP